MDVVLSDCEGEFGPRTSSPDRGAFVMNATYCADEVCNIRNIQCLHDLAVNVMPLDGYFSASYDLHATAHISE